MGITRDHRLAAIARRQHGVFTSRQAHAIGIDRALIHSRVEQGHYLRLHAGVLAFGGVPDTHRRRLVAAALSFPDLAAVSHEAAAELWGLTSRGIQRVDVVTTRWDRVRRVGVHVHESLDLVDDDILSVDGVPVTTAVRTVVDLGASNRWIVEAAFESGVRAGLFRPADVEAFVQRVARRGRRGVGVIRPILEARRRWDHATESALEDRFCGLLADDDLPLPVAQWVIRDAKGRFVSRADFAYPDRRVLIELDSEAHHMDRPTFRNDRAKQNRTTLLGWTTLRYTWFDVVERPGQVCRQIRQLLADESQAG